MNMSVICTGCGVPLQMDSPDEPGYITGVAFVRDKPLCRRCYRLRHYGEFTPSSLGEQDYRAIVARVLAKPSLVVYVLDLFDFNGSLLRGMEGMLRPHDVILVANKFDLFPRGTSLPHVEEWILREARRAGIAARESRLVSARTGLFVPQLWEAIKERAKGRQIVAIGMANVGKSSLLNRFIAIEREGETELTASIYPGTTLGAVSLKLPEGAGTLVDTPGLMARYRLQDIVGPEAQKVLLPAEPLRPRVYQLRPEQTLFLGGLARFDFDQGEPQSFVVYAANTLAVHRTATKNADELYARQVGRLLYPPGAEADPSLRNLRSKSLSFRAGKPVDVAVAGLGWIRLSGQSGRYHVHVPTGVEIAVRPALIAARRETAFVRER